MDNKALARSNSDTSQDFMRDSRALLTTEGRERTYEEFERSPHEQQKEKKLQRSSTEILCINAKTMAEAARKKRATIIDYSSKQLDTKIQLLTAQKQIERQIELLKTVTAENKEAAKEQLKAYMSEAYIAIEKANAPQQDIAPTNATLASIQAADEADRMMLENLEAQVSETGNSNSNNNSNNTKSAAVTKKSSRTSFGEEEDIHAVLARTDKILERAEASLARNRTELVLSPRAEKLRIIMQEVEQKAQERPDVSYEILLEYIQTHRELFLSKMHEEDNAGLHTGIQRMIVHKHPLDYILFATMLECGVDRTLVYDGRTLLDAAMDSGNEMLVQLLTTEHPTKQTLIDLAFEHHKDDLIPYLLSEEECFQRACQDIDSGANNNNSNI